MISDSTFLGGGLHETKRDGLLKIHTDFAKHRVSNLDRRLNVLVFLNKDWNEEYGGALELWDSDMNACKMKILPTFNRIAIFETTNKSYHGHPDPLTCPEDITRKSMALYYYSDDRPRKQRDKWNSEKPTTFFARPENREDSNVIRNYSLWRRAVNKAKQTLEIDKKA